MKYDAIVNQGIAIHERVPIPDELVPEDSRVEIDAKIHAGYCKSELQTYLSFKSPAKSRVIYSHHGQSPEHWGVVRSAWAAVGRCWCEWGFTSEHREVSILTFSKHSIEFQHFQDCRKRLGQTKSTLEKISVADFWRLHWRMYHLDLVLYHHPFIEKNQFTYPSARSTLWGLRNENMSHSSLQIEIKIDITIWRIQKVWSWCIWLGQPMDANQVLSPSHCKNTLGCPRGIGLFLNESRGTSVQMDPWCIVEKKAYLSRIWASPSTHSSWMTSTTTAGGDS